MTTNKTCTECTLHYWHWKFTQRSSNFLETIENDWHPIHILVTNRRLMVGSRNARDDPTARRPALSDLRFPAKKISLRYRFENAMIHETHTLSMRSLSGNRGESGDGGDPRPVSWRSLRLMGDTNGGNASALSWDLSGMNWSLFFVKYEFVSKLHDWDSFSELDGDPSSSIISKLLEWRPIGLKFDLKLKNNWIYFNLSMDWKIPRSGSRTCTSRRAIWSEWYIFQASSKVFIRRTYTSTTRLHLKVNTINNGILSSRNNNKYNLEITHRFYCRFNNWIGLKIKHFIFNSVTNLVIDINNNKINNNTINT